MGDLVQTLTRAAEEEFYFPEPRELWGLPFRPFLVGDDAATLEYRRHELFCRLALQQDAKKSDRRRWAQRLAALGGVRVDGDWIVLERGTTLLYDHREEVNTKLGGVETFIKNLTVAINKVDRAWTPERLDWEGLRVHLLKKKGVGPLELKHLTLPDIYNILMSPSKGATKGKDQDRVRSQPVDRRRPTHPELSKREVAVIAMRDSPGHSCSFQEIANRFNISKSAAHKIYQRAIRKAGRKIAARSVQTRSNVEDYDERGHG